MNAVHHHQQHHHLHRHHGGAAADTAGAVESRGIRTCEVRFSFIVMFALHIYAMLMLSIYVYIYL